MIYLQLEHKEQLESLNLELSQYLIDFLGDNTILFRDACILLKIAINDNIIEDFCWNNKHCDNCQYEDSCLLKDKHCITFNTYLRTKKLERICYQEDPQI